jgi:hypothetical protein
MFLHREELHILFYVNSLSADLTFVQHLSEGERINALLKAEVDLRAGFGVKHIVGFVLGEGFTKFLADKSALAASFSLSRAGVVVIIAGNVGLLPVAEGYFEHTYIRTSAA